MNITYERVRKNQKELLEDMLKEFVDETAQYSNNILIQKADEPISPDLYYNAPYDTYIKKETGFAIVKKEYDIWLMDLFLIRKQYRNRKVGETVAIAIFDKYKGNWRIGVNKLNHPALNFWKKVVSEYIGEPFPLKDPPPHGSFLLEFNATTRSYSYDLQS